MQTKSFWNCWTSLFPLLFQCCKWGRESRFLKRTCLTFFGSSWPFWTIFLNVNFSIFSVIFVYFLSSLFCDNLLFSCFAYFENLIVYHFLRIIGIPIILLKFVSTLIFFALRNCLLSFLSCLELKQWAYFLSRTV